MSVIELIGQVDEQHRLSADVPPSVRPGRVKVVIQVLEGTEEEDPEAWTRAIAQAWAADWSDPREDIYTLEDGKPEN